MTQNLASSPFVIYDVLTNDEDFMDLVGSYTFVKGNTVIDSISIVTPGADLPQVKSQSGLEVIIHDSGDTNSFKYLTSLAEAIPTWRVFLIVWPPATGDTMHDATRRMIEIFGNATAMETVATTDGLGSLVQTMVSIPANSPILG